MVSAGDLSFEVFDGEVHHVTRTGYPANGLGVFLGLLSVRVGSAVASTLQSPGTCVAIRAKHDGSRGCFAYGAVLLFRSIDPHDRSLEDHPNFFSEHPMTDAQREANAKRWTWEIRQAHRNFRRKEIAVAVFSTLYAM